MRSMLEYKGYHATVEYDADDDIFVGEVFGLKDSLNFHGSTLAELKEMFAQSIDNYLEHCAKIGKTPDKEFKGAFYVRLPGDLHRSAALLAEEEKISLNQLVVNSLSDTVNAAHQKIAAQ